MKYTIRYTETNVGYFDVEAPDEFAAIDEFWRQVETGWIDLLRTEMMESDAEVVIDDNTDEQN